MTASFWHPFDMSSVLSTARATVSDVQTRPPVELGRGPRSLDGWFVPTTRALGELGNFCTVIMKGTVRQAVPLFPNVDKAMAFLGRLGLQNYELVLVPDAESFVALLPLDFDVVADPGFLPNGKVSYSKLDRAADGTAVPEVTRGSK